MSGLYGARFADAWRGVDPSVIKKVWATELGGYSAEEIVRGLQMCSKRDWPPTLPEFLKMCRPALDYLAAYNEAVEQMRLRNIGQDSWSDPAIFWAAVYMGTDLTHYSYELVKKSWQQKIDDAKEKVAAGKLSKTIHPRREALPKPARVLSRDEWEKIDARFSELFNNVCTKPVHKSVNT